eukprot:3527419-Rhodomonas_salina.1
MAPALPFTAAVSAAVGKPHAERGRGERREKGRMERSLLRRGREENRAGAGKRARNAHLGSRR